ncbi:PKD domain-containing protein [Sulfidibacter corallicola]|uniref:PKD domain-containing protein n=1 Tax=Sulfidibacter corallicola TaxID=2818388 RepID=A0A8A4TCP9_SULCO|nr:PKD domain-containing protein [Sulfidibacter corallicola]QTD47716.1 PKD domain-containing protein [Sulfidibacter corallicola]
MLKWFDRCTVLVSTILWGLLCSLPIQAQTELPWASFTGGAGDFAYMANPDETVFFEINGRNAENLGYQWDFGNGQTGTGEAPTTTYAEPGIYQVTLTVSNDQGQTGTPFRRWLFVHDPRIVANAQEIPPWPFFNRPANGATFALGEEISFQGHGFDAQDDGVTLYWDFGDGNLLSGQTEPTHSYGDAGVWFPNLFAVDSKGNIQSNLSFVAIQVYEGRKPPNGVIVAPVANNATTGDYEIQVGGQVTLRGRVEAESDLGEITSYWNILDNDNGVWFMLDGSEPPAQTWEAGYYSAFFHTAAAEDENLRDEIVDTVNIWVRDTNRPPQNVSIVEPNFDHNILLGSELGLSGVADDLDGDELCFKWEVDRYPWGSEPPLRWEQPFVDNMALDRAGLYRISLQVEDSFGAATFALTRFVQVLDPEAVCEVPHPVFQPISPADTTLSGPVGVTFNFEIGFLPQEGQVIEDVFWDFSDGREIAGSRLDPVGFSEPGWYPIRVFARDQCGLWSFGEMYSLFVFGDNIPPEATIAEPSCNVRDERNQCVFAVPVGQPVTIRGTPSDADGQLPLSSVWWIDGTFYDIGETPPPFTFTEAGEHLIEYFVTDAGGVGNTFPSQTVVRVIDPSLEPDSRIVFPDGDITVAPGDALTFEGFGEDPNGLALTYEWDFGTAANIQRAVGSYVSGISFANSSPPGQPYVVSLKATTPFTAETTAATVRVTVQTFEDGNFEPNDGLDNAAELQQGNYDNLRLSDGDDLDVFRFAVNQSERNLRVQIRTEDDLPATVTLYRLEGETYVPVRDPQSSEDALVVQDVEPGAYAVSIAPVNDAKRRMNLSYGLTINTLQPSLYLPFLVEDGNLASSIGLINPSGQPTQVNLQGLDAQGIVITTISLRMEAGAHMYTQAADLFGGDADAPAARDIKWVRVSAETRLVGYTSSESEDDTRLMSTGGLRSLSPGITVPHIADPNNGWYTRAIIVNAGEVDSPLRFRAPDLDWQVAELAKTNSQTDFRFDQRLAGPLPGWGEFETTNGEAGLAGIEVFGRTDQQREMAGIEMINTRRENPNFAYQGDEIYFTHIARDTINWWTGISLINVGASTANFNLVGYDNDGQVKIRLDNQSLPAGGKLLKTARDLFGEVQVDWLKVEADGGLAGFELFGDHGLNRLAGFQAATALTDRLYFPHVSFEDGRQWTGISLLNVAPVAVDIQISAYDANGQLLVRTSRQLGPNTKWVAVAQDLFAPETLPAAARYLRVDANQKSICGFELFGTLTDTGLGEQLAGLAAIPF